MIFLGYFQKEEKLGIIVRCDNSDNGFNQSSLRGTRSVPKQSPKDCFALKSRARNDEMDGKRLELKSFTHHIFIFKLFNCKFELIFFIDSHTDMTAFV